MTTTPDSLRRSIPTTSDDHDDAIRAVHDKLAAQGVLCTDMDTALRKHAEVIDAHSGQDWTALSPVSRSRSWFVYIPPGINVEFAVEAHSRATNDPGAKAEHTLIVADRGSTVHYIDGCAAPIYTPDAERSSTVEVVVREGANVRYTITQNWSTNVVNRLAMRAVVEADGHLEWIDGNTGALRTEQDIAVRLTGRRASLNVWSVAFSGARQHQDIGVAVLHAAPETRSNIVSKSILKDGGRADYRGQVSVDDNMHGCVSHVQTDELSLDDSSGSDGVNDADRQIDTSHRDAGQIEPGRNAPFVEEVHTSAKIAGNQRFYLMSRGLSAQQATGMIVNGFIEPVTRNLPVEYAVEWTRLIELQVEGAIG